MNGSAKIQPTHQQRQAVVYIRQSDPKQVLKNRESAVNQKALKERLLELGWSKKQISVIDEDQGVSARHASGRAGFQKLAADVGLGKIGVIMGYEVSRLSRNCADWHRLLELCALFDTLIGDTDGIYHPRDFNDRLLLGLKGTMSEAELHSLRLRLDAGRLSKAKRGELIQPVPTGLVRNAAGVVEMDPDVGVQARIRLVFQKFFELGSARKVLHYLAKHDLKLPRRQASGLYAGELFWKAPSAQAVRTMLSNPAYAGAFAYGRRIAKPTRQVPGRPATGRIRQPRANWLALVKDVYPAYITWEEYERIQHMIAKNHEKMGKQLARSQAVRSGAALLTGLVRCGKCGHAMPVRYADQRFQYICNAASLRYAKSNCQYIAGHGIDEAVVQAFFDVLHSSEIDALQSVHARQSEHRKELLSHLEKDVTRLQYEAQRAERQYNCVDPENRLIAATLEKKWEDALSELEQAKARLDETRAKETPTIAIPTELREAFVDVGRHMADVWQELSHEARKRLLRTLVTGVNLNRHDDGTLQIRIVWRGDQVTEKVIRVRSLTLRGSEAEKKLVERVRQLASEGLNDTCISERLNEEGFVPCRADGFTRQVVTTVRRRYQIISTFQKAREAPLPGVYKVAEMAKKIRIDPSWIYRNISRGVIKIAKDKRFGCYLFPRNQKIVALMRQLKRKDICHVSIPEVH